MRNRDLQVQYCIVTVWNHRFQCTDGIHKDRLHSCSYATTSARIGVTKLT